MYGVSALLHPARGPDPPGSGLAGGVMELESGIEPGTAFEDIPEDWVCPVCGVGKDDFEPYEEE